MSSNGDTTCPLIENKVPNDDRFVRYNWKIDNFAVVRKGFEKPSIIKIDVEKEELEVLKGAEQTITKYRPAMCIEAHEVLFTEIPEGYGRCIYDGHVRFHLLNPCNHNHLTSN